MPRETVWWRWVALKAVLAPLLNRFMQDRRYGFPRISLLGNSVNRGHLFVRVESLDFANHRPNPLPNRSVRIRGYLLWSVAREWWGSSSRRNYPHSRWRHGPTRAPRLRGRHHIRHSRGHGWRSNWLLGRS